MRQIGTWLVALLLGMFVGYGVWVYMRLPTQPLPGGPRVARYGFRPVEDGSPVPMAEAVAQARIAPARPATLQGRVVDMGPTMGCWLLIQDGSGEILVQTEPMAYKPQKVRGATVKVTGRLLHTRLAGMGYYRQGWFLVTPGVEVVEPR